MAEAAVVGVPDAVYGENVVAFVVVKPGAAVSEDEVIEHVCRKVARFKAPSHGPLRAGPAQEQHRQDLRRVLRDTALRLLEAETRPEHRTENSIIGLVAMRAMAIWLGVCGVLSVAAGAEEQPLRWLRNLDEAKGVAAAGCKELLVNFTGLDWCGHCMELDSEVLSRQEFRAAAADYVLVDLDFPNDRDELAALKDSYDAWVKQYRIHSYPTVMLADASGKPYAFFTGYDHDVDVVEFLQQLAQARQTRQTRDALLTAARQATGAARAQKLHAAISAVATALGPLEDREDDPVLTFYPDEVAEIWRLDADNDLGLRSVYEARTRARDAYRRGVAILAGVDQYHTKEDGPAAIAYLDKQLQEVSDASLRYRLERKRCNLLEWMERNEEALAGLAPAGHGSGVSRRRSQWAAAKPGCSAAAAWTDATKAWRYTTSKSPPRPTTVLRVRTS